MVKRIALSGMPLSGKTTLAKFMWEHYGYRHASMSGYLIDEYVTLLNVPWMVESRGGQIVDAADIIERKEDYRAGLQVLGDEYGLQDPYQVVGFMQQVLAACGAWQHPDEPVVLEAIRGEVQASAARALGFVVVELVVDEETRYRRAGGSDVYRQLQSSVLARPDLESGVASASIRLTNELSVDAMAKFLTILPKEGLSHGPADQLFTPNCFAGWASYQ